MLLWVCDTRRLVRAFVDRQCDKCTNSCAGHFDFWKQMPKFEVVVCRKKLVVLYRLIIRAMFINKNQNEEEMFTQSARIKGVTQLISVLVVCCFENRYMYKNNVLNIKPCYEGCSNMNASGFITFVTYMLRQNGIRFYKGVYVTFKLVPDIKTNTVYLSSYSPLNEGLFSILTNQMLRTYEWYRRAYNTSINRWNFLKFLRKYLHILL